MRLRLLLGDNIDRMPELGSVGAVVSDPPYGLRFMGKEFDTLGDGPAQQLWHHAWLKAAYDLLPSGGLVLAFGGTRTFHRMAAAMEDVGFEVIGLRAWAYSTGFPKSHNISKKLDQMAGAEREVIGTKPGVGGENMNDIVHGRSVRTHEDEGGKGVGAYGTGAKQIRIEIPVTAPATEPAKAWDGWGTALKPAFEPVVVARKP